MVFSGLGYKKKKRKDPTGFFLLVHLGTVDLKLIALRRPPPLLGTSIVIVLIINVVYSLVERLLAKY